MDKRLILGILFVSVAVIISSWFWYGISRPKVHEVDTIRTAVTKIEKISVWQHGRLAIIDKNSTVFKKLASYLISTLQKVNLQAKCAVFEDKIDLLKKNGEIIVVTFSKPVNITISQQIKSQEEKYIKVNESGYRILTRVDKIVFVLDGDLAGHILTKSVDEKGYGCWAISRKGEIDKKWVYDIERMMILFETNQSD